MEFTEDCPSLQDQFHFNKIYSLNHSLSTNSQSSKLRKMDNSKATEDNPPSQDTWLLQKPPFLPPQELTSAHQ
ncbi:hypothetical protein A6R68_02723, partial [Neotoma lepida]